MKRLLILAAFCFASMLSLQAQMGKNWCFGLNSGLRFDEDSVRVFHPKIAYDTTYSNPALHASSMSDCHGDLWLYSSSTLVWDKNQNLMPNCRPINNSCSAKYLGILLPKPNDDSTFFMFHPSYNGCNDDGVFYSEIDMRLRNGLGDVVSTKKNIKFADTTFEEMAVFKHNNDTDFWIICCPFRMNVYKLYAYKVTSKGVQKPIITSLPWGTVAFCIRASHKNNKLTFGSFNNTNLVYIIDFNSKTGTFTNLKPIMLQSQVPLSVNSFKQYPSGLEFSVNDSLIYYTTVGTASDSDRILQLQPFTVKPTKNITYIYRGFKVGTIGAQVGPDNKIYVGLGVAKMMGRIEYPDKIGKACGFTFNFNGQDSVHFGNYLPNLYFPLYRINFSLSSSNGCFDDSTVVFYNQSDTVFKQYTWYFGDGDSAVVTNKKPLPHKYKAEGKYFITLKGVKQPCNYPLVWKDSIDVHFAPKPAYIIDSTTTTCSSYTYYISNTTANTDSVIINWGDGGKSISYTYNSYSHTYNKLNDTFLISLTAWKKGCSSTIQNKLSTYYNLYASPLLADSISTCKGSITSLSARQGFTYQWNTGQQGASIVVNPVVNQYYYVTATDTKGCNATDSVLVKLNTTPVTSFQTNNLAACGGSNFAFIDTSSFNSIIQYRTWQLQNGNFDTTIKTTGNNTLNIYLTDTGNYIVSLKVTTFEGCTDSLTKTNYIRVSPLPDVRISQAGKLVVCYSDSVQISVPFKAGSKYLWSNKDTNSFIYATKQGIYSATVWNKENCFDKSATVTVSFLAPFNAIIKQSANKDTLSIQTVRRISSYLWLKDGNAFANNTNATVIHPTSGAYTCTLTDTSGCVAKTNSITITGISLLAASESLSIYPNPTSNELTIAHIPSSVEFITLSDLSGKTYIHLKTSGAGLLHMSLGHLASGIYILAVGEQFLKVVVE